MCEQRFQTGDSVQLKSGKGPIMTVEEVRNNGDVQCKWPQEPGSGLYCWQLIRSNELTIVQKHNYFPQYPTDVV